MTLKNNRAPLLCYFKLCMSFRIHWWIQTGVTVGKHRIWVKIDYFAVWPWNLTEDIAKQWGNSFIQCQALCILSKPWVNPNWSYSPETLNSGQNWWFFVLCDHEIWQMTVKKKGHLFYTSTSFVHLFKAISDFKLELQFGNVQFVPKLAICGPCGLEVWWITFAQ